jgi:hypothetical protein
MPIQSLDEAYVKIWGRWGYLYRTVDRDGNTMDFRQRCKRDVAAAKVHLRKAPKTQQQAPLSITLNGYVASHRPRVADVPTAGEGRRHSSPLAIPGVRLHGRAMCSLSDLQDGKGHADTSAKVAILMRPCATGCKAAFAPSRSLAEEAH